MKNTIAGRLVCALVAIGLSVRALAAPAGQIPFDDTTIPQLQAAMAAGKLTSEQLVKLCLARINAFDQQGPNLHAIITLNPNALKEARALDAERRSKGPRSALHGIPVLVKDNYNTVDMPTTGGSLMLEGSVPNSDAYMVRRLRAAGAIILAKMNLGEFASGGFSSLGGQSHNPHDLTRTPAGSSGGTGVGIAAGYSPLGFGTDTGGSIRGPSSVNGIVGLKPTHGLVSREGIIPLSLSLDTGGPMARSVTDIAVALSQLTGVDPNDEATRKSTGKFQTDYTQYLKADALKGARIGLVRDFSGYDTDVDWVMEAAVAAMRRAGATVIDVHYPKWFLDSYPQINAEVYKTEFPAQLGEYLKKYTSAQYPKSLDELIERATMHLGLGPNGQRPDPSRWAAFEHQKDGPGFNDPKYRVIEDHYVPMARAVIVSILSDDKLDALVYPTSVRRPALIAAPPLPPGATNPDRSPTSVANITGFPDLIVPAGFTGDALPVGISFFGDAFSEPKLIGLGYSFEQATHARSRPVTTPALPGSTIDIPTSAH
jgi:amidase